MLLFAASDLYHRPDATPETGYASPQDRDAMWRAAQDAGNRGDAAFRPALVSVLGLVAVVVVARCPNRVPHGCVLTFR